MGFKTSFRRLASISVITLLSAGCTHNMVRDMAGSGMVSFGNEYIAPWFMASDDTDVMCAMGEGMGAMAYPLGPNVDPMIPMLTLASGMCAGERAKEEELRYIRAMRKNDAEEAQDALTMQKRWLELAARRQYFGYQAVERYFGGVGDECPEFSDRNEKMSFMFGLFGGIQAFQTDLSNGGTAGVPLSVMPKSIKALDCLDNEEFWGLPLAIKSSVDIMKANIGGEKESLSVAMGQLESASQIGQKQGVRIVQLVQASLYSAMGREDLTKQVIREHVKLKQTVAANPELKILDEMTTRGLRLISDKMWTQNTGQRTPYNALGTFWDDQTAGGAAQGMDIEDLL